MSPWAAPPALGLEPQGRFGGASASSPGTPSRRTSVASPGAASCRASVAVPGRHRAGPGRKSQGLLVLNFGYELPDGVVQIVSHEPQGRGAPCAGRGKFPDGRMRSRVPEPSQVRQPVHQRRQAQL
eukprot:13885408-Alexandrium_andersonii.AAC.1